MINLSQFGTLVEYPARNFLKQVKTVQPSDWTNAHKSVYLESLFIGLPQYPITAELAETGWLIHDGNKRIEALKLFFSDKLILSGTDIEPQWLDGFSFRKAPRYLRSCFEMAALPIFLLRKGSKQEMPVILYEKLINRKVEIYLNKEKKND